MKIRFLIIFSILMFFALNSCYGKPVAHFNKTVHDFGVVRKNASLTYTFILTNKGTSTLRIERLRAG